MGQGRRNDRAPTVHNPDPDIAKLTLDLVQPRAPLIPRLQAGCTGASLVDPGSQRKSSAKSRRELLVHLAALAAARTQHAHQPLRNDAQEHIGQPRRLQAEFDQAEDSAHGITGPDGDEDQSPLFGLQTCQVRSFEILNIGDEEYVPPCPWDNPPENLGRTLTAWLIGLHLLEAR